jgi:hypothetical protein
MLLFNCSSSNLDEKVAGLNMSSPVVLSVGRLPSVELNAAAKSPEIE